MRAFWAGVLLACAGAAWAQSQPVAPEGRPETGAPLRDREFGVSTRQFGLQRKVEMYQWRREGGSFGKAWSDAPIDSTGYPADRANPAFSLQTRYWVADDVRLDDKPLDEDVLKAMGEWRAFRPNFSALPGNLSVTFQPEGNGLGSAENPLDPQVGDLRITWRELVLPPLVGKVVLRDGTWVVASPEARDAQPGEAHPTAQPTTMPPSPAGARHHWLWAACVLAAVLAFVLLRRRRA